MSFTLATWNLSPGQYLIANMMRTSSPGGISDMTVLVSHHGRIKTAGVAAYYDAAGGQVADVWADGILSASTSALPGSLHLTDIQRTGSFVMPGFIMHGTF